MSSRHSATAARLRQGNLSGFPFTLYRSPTSRIDFTPEPPEGSFVAMKFGDIRYKKYRLKLLKRKPFCWYCNCRVDEKTGSLDHLIPSSRGGPDAPWNLVLACVDCNGRKNDRTPAEWLEMMQCEIATAQARVDKLLARIEEHQLWEPAPDPNPVESEKIRLPSGHKSFSIVALDGRSIVSGLSGSMLLHYLEAVGTLPDGLRVVRIEKVWIKEFGVLANGRRPEPEDIDTDIEADDADLQAI